MNSPKQYPSQRPNVIFVNICITRFIGLKYRQLRVKANSSCWTRYMCSAWRVSIQIYSIIKNYIPKFCPVHMFCKREELKLRKPFQVWKIFRQDTQRWNQANGRFHNKRYDEIISKLGTNSMEMRWKGGMFVFWTSSMSFSNLVYVFLFSLCFQFVLTCYKLRMKEGRRWDTTLMLNVSSNSNSPRNQRRRITFAFIFSQN